MLYCKSKTIEKRIVKIKNKYPETVSYLNELNYYTETINKRRRSYYFVLYITNILRFLQTISGLGITLLTTNNNPYFVDYEELINIYLWYLAIFSTCTNMILEFIQNKYNITNKKIILDLLKGESYKLFKEYCPYDSKNNLTNHHKIIYFNNTIDLIDNHSQESPIEGLSRPYRQSTPKSPNNNRPVKTKSIPINSILPIEQNNLTNTQSIIVDNYIENKTDNTTKEHNQDNKLDDESDDESDDEDNWSFFKKWF